MNKFDSLLNKIINEDYVKEFGRYRSSHSTNNIWITFFDKYGETIDKKEVNITHPAFGSMWKEESIQDRINSHRQFKDAVKEKLTNWIDNNESLDPEDGFWEIRDYYGNLYLTGESYDIDEAGPYTDED